MNGVIIEVYVHFTGMSKAFGTALLAERKKQTSVFTYRGTMFRVRYIDGRIHDVRAILSSLEAPLPAVLRDELVVNYVTVRARIPASPLAAEGWYQGENFGLPSAGCLFDPLGIKSDGNPRFYGSGTNFHSLTTLFRRVLAGELTPGCGDNKWSGEIYVHN